MATTDPHPGRPATTPVRIARSLLALAAGAGLTVASAATSTADPVNANSFPLDLSCDNGQQYTVIVRSTAPEQAAVHVIDTTSALIPTRFQWHIAIIDEHGTILSEEAIPAEAVHGRSGYQLDTTKCTFIQFAYHDWPDVGPVIIEVDGTVDAYLPR